MRIAFRALVGAVIGGLLGYLWWLSVMWQAEALGPAVVRDVMPTILFLPIFVLCGVSCAFISKERHGPWAYAETATVVSEMFLAMPAMMAMIPLLPGILETPAIMIVVGIASLLHQWIFFRLNRRAGWPPPVSPPSA